ncbi:MAG TPA: hypothetical protein VFG97_07125 [Pedococcus sp.]|nr:hypothetical protein [Pedococcus sp.]
MPVTDPLFVAAEVAYRFESFSGANRTSAGRHHSRRWMPDLHLRVHHRHARHMRPA